jgi:acetyltransferase
VELIADRAVALPPLNEPLARELVSRTRVSRLLGAYRDRPAADIAAVHRVLVQVSRLVAALPEVVELDINPLLADADGAIALDARVRIDLDFTAAVQQDASRMAIRPYPAELKRTIEWQGRTLVIRPIRPEDAQRHLAFLERIDPEDIRMRAFVARRSIARSELARLTQIDYEREMAFVALSLDTGGNPETVGAARAVTDPDNHEAEFGILVRSDLKGQGLGRLMLAGLVDYCRGRGTRYLVGDVLTENAGMLSLGRSLGFETAPSELQGCVQLVLDLAQLPANAQGRTATGVAAAT